MNWLPRTSSRIRREAADWIAQLGSGFDAAKSDAFALWYGDSRNAEAYDRLASIWAISAEANLRTVSSKSVRAPYRPIGRIALLGSLLAVLVLIGALFLGAKSMAPDRETLILASALGEVRPVRLPDGSRVVLDSASKVAVEYSGQVRRLRLVSGRARFEASGERRPFEVAMGFNRFEADGAVFDLSLIEGPPTAYLLRGSLTLAGADGFGHGWSMRAGEMVRIAPGARPQPTPVRASDLSWPRRMLEFDRTPLRDAVALANRYSAAQIRLANPDLGDLAVSGAYRTGDTAGLARGLAVAFGLKLDSSTRGELILSRKDRMPSPMPAG